tara:strand:- start:4279 stop:4458 length:180 start_codon:yes stop_codon:yes gene_type:complete
MWTLKEEYNAAWPALVGISALDALTILSLRGGWITDGIEVADTNYFTDKFEFRKGEAKK